MPEQLSLPDLPAPPPPPPPPAAAVLIKARSIWAASTCLRRQFKNVDALLAHPQYGAWLLMCARGALKARERARRPAPPTTNGLPRQD